MPDPYVTIEGNVATEPREASTKNGGAFATFRLASNGRHYDTRERRYVDGATSFYTVACWRESFVSNVMASVSVGDPVIVRGRLQIKSWSDDAGASHLAPEVTCYSLGHDLSKGKAEFTRVTAERQQAEPDDDDPVLDHHIAYAVGADPATGEKLAQEEVAVA